jgi:hypothetical protein
VRLVTCLIATSACTGSMPDGDPGDTLDAPPMLAPAVSRAMAWVDAKVPYCQAPNHQPDADTDCSATCTRPDNPDWDPYRSDCSGLVSWAWGLPPPGRTTATLAPFDMTASMVIAGADLQPGDAINNDHHTMLFADWIVPGSEAHFIEEPGCSATQPYAREVDAMVTITGETVTVQYRGDYTAIRYVP